MDVFLYNGPLERGLDLEFIEWVAREKKSTHLTLALVTGGGNPDAAYKIGRYLQSKYEDLTVFVPGICKSAGTLLSIAANSIVFSPFGELGPLDVQLFRRDDMSQESGLNISEALSTLDERARQTYNTLIQEILRDSGGIVSFTTASHSAAEILSGLYGPIFASIDPEEVGSRTRAMRVGEDYGFRLNSKFQNLKSEALTFLTQKYSSHSFVIDAPEASILFNRVRIANQAEQVLVEELGHISRNPGSNLINENLTAKYHDIVGKIENGSENQKEAGSDDNTRRTEAAGAGAAQSEQKKRSAPRKRAPKAKS